MTTMTHNDAVNSLASERYLLNEMTAAERDAFEAHVFECPDCADDVTTAARMRDGVAEGLLPASPVARVATFTPTPPPRPAPWYRSTTLPWAVAATLAIAVGYQAQRPAAPSSEGTPVLMAPVVLRPASRGALPSVRLTGSHVAVALDVDTGTATRVSYRLKDAAGATLATGEQAVTAGAPLVLVIPAFTLTPEQQYSLSVHDAAEPSRPLGEYPFTTTR